MIDYNSERAKEAIAELLKWRDKCPQEFQEVISSSNPPLSYFLIKEVLPIAGMTIEEFVGFLGVVKRL